MNRIPCPQRLAHGALATLALGTLLAATAGADPLAVTGLLRSASGGPVADGSYGFVVKLYSDADGKQQAFKELFVGVPVKAGLFQITLGLEPQNPFDGKALASKAKYVGVQVDSDPELPLVPLVPVLRAYVADHALTANEALNAKTADLATAAGTAKNAEFAVVANSAKSAESAASAEVAKNAKSAEFAAVADEAKTLQCTGCIKSAHLDAGVLAPFAKAADLHKVAKSGLYQDLDGLPDVSGVAKLGADNTWTGKNSFAGLFLGGNEAKGLRFENLDKDPVTCEAKTAGYVYYHSAKQALMLCNGKEWFPLQVTVPIGTQASPGASCKDILKQAPGAPTGAYWVKTPGGTYQVWCDMVNDGGGWTLLLNNTDGTMRHILQQDTDLASPDTPGSHKRTFDLLAQAGEIRYADTLGAPFLTATIDMASYVAALKQTAVKPVAIQYTKGPLAGKQRYIEVHNDFHWGHRNGVGSVDGKPTNVSDVYSPTCMHTCWEHASSVDRPFAGDHCPSSTSVSFCPGADPQYKFPPEATRGGSFKFRKWVR